MRDGFQQALHELALSNMVTRDLVILCASVLVYLMGAAWLVAVIRRRATLTAVVAGRIVVLGVVAFLMAKVLGHVIIDPRPYLLTHTQPLIPTAHDNGFPSDHTLLAAFLMASLWWIDRRVVPAFAVAALLVAVGRLGIDAHHTLDVVGSMAITIVAALVAGAVPLPTTWQRPLFATPREEAGSLGRRGVEHDAVT